MKAVIDRLRFAVLGGLLAAAPAVRAEVLVEPAPAVAKSYAVQAVAVDAVLLSAGVMTSLAWPNPYPRPPSHVPNFGPVLTGVAALTGGALTHTLYGNRDLRWQSVGLRAKHMGLGALWGFGSGAVLGAGTMGVCGLSGAGYCPLALSYGLILGPVVGATIGLGRGAFKDYATLAKRPVRGNKIARATWHPVFGVSVHGSAHCGLAGSF